MAKAAKATRKPVPLWLWLLNLAAASGFVYFLYHLQSIPDKPVPVVTRPASPATAPATPPAAGTKPTPQPPTQTATQDEPRFKFYEMLPKSGVDTAPVEVYAPKTPKVTYDYLIQTGSFRNREDAEKQKARIAFQGLRAEIREITTENGTWYRVQIGPVSNRSVMNKMVDKLVALNIQPLVKKIRRDDQ